MAVADGNVKFEEAVRLVDDIDAGTEDTLTYGGLVVDD